MKIRVVIDVEKGVIQVRNGLDTTMEVLPFNVVNMLHKISRPEASRHDQMRKGFSKMSLEQWCIDEIPAWDSTSTLSNSANCINDSLSERDFREEEEIANYNLYKILPIEEFLIEELNDHGMN
jgi:hypothetical protein